MDRHLVDGAPFRAVRVLLPAAVGLLLLAGCSSSTAGHAAVGTSAAVSKTVSQLDKQRNAFTSCKEAVTDRLKSPSTASFEPESQVEFQTVGDDGIQILGYVDSQNGFGAQVRSDYVCTASVDSVGIVRSTTVSSIHTRGT